MDYLIGEIKMFAGKYAPKGFAFCHGQLLSIAGHKDLYSILGAMYGGDGITTFALPDYRGKSPMGKSGETKIGDTGGNENATLSANNLPSHSHQLNNIVGTILAKTFDGAESPNPTGRYMGGTDALGAGIYGDSSNAEMANNAVKVSGNTEPSGSGEPFSVLPPHLITNFIIAIRGSYPSPNTMSY